MRSGRPTTVSAFLKLFADVVRTVRTVASASDKPKILANAGSRAVLFHSTQLRPDVKCTFHPWNNPSGDALAITAITRFKEQTLHETAFIDRICSLHFFARSNSVRIGNAERKPECTYCQH